MDKKAFCLPFGIVQVGFLGAEDIPTPPPNGGPAHAGATHQ